MGSFRRLVDRLPPWSAAASPAIGVMLVLAFLSSAYLLANPVRQPEARLLWLFSKEHDRTYAPIIQRWNEEQEPDVRAALLGVDALRSRMLSGFLGGLPTADLIEVERAIIPTVFAGPIDSVGFLDLTELLRRDGLLEAINAPSFSPWSREGRIFGLPHDVHSVLMIYRSDIVEAAGIDVSQIETWDDFERVMGPLVQDLDGDGRTDRYLISFWPNPAFRDQIEVYILQAGGQLFDSGGAPALSSDPVVDVVARLGRWTAEPGRIAEDVPEFNASANQQRLEGRVVCAIAPDWLCRVWKNDMPGLAGKVKIMPLPAWTPGGRRTSVWGGTMLGIPKTAEDVEDLWRFAKHLYTSEELAAELYVTSDIISPIKTHWDKPFYDEPDPFFGGQRKARMYIEAAPHVPMRDSHPLRSAAIDHITNATLALRNWITANPDATREQIRERARALLAERDDLLQRELDRNVFLSRTPDEPGEDA